MSLHQPSLPPVLGLLDVGTAKIICLVLGRGDGGTFKLVGVGHQRARGLKAGVVVDVEAAEDAVRAAIEQAEDMAGHKLESVVMAAGCGRQSSLHLSAGVDLAAGVVNAADVDGLLQAGRRYAERDDRVAMHVNSLAMRLDGQLQPNGALGARGRHLTLDVHAVAADQAPLRQLRHLAERCQLQVLAIGPAPISSALAVTTATERQRGVLVIDFGAGTTGMALFLDGTLVAIHLVPIGGNHLTFDLTRALGISIGEAERIKKKCAMLGSAQPVPDDTIAYQPGGDDHATSKQVSRAHISTILTSRIDSLLSQLLQRLEPLAVAPDRYGQVLLTGGGSALAGLATAVGRVFGLPARVAMPVAGGALPPALLQAGFATAAGLETMIVNASMGFWLNAPLAAAPAPAWGNAGWGYPDGARPGFQAGQ